MIYLVYIHAMNIHADKELLYQKLHERKLIGYFMDDIEYLPEKEPNFNQLIRDGDFDIVRYFLEKDPFEYEKQLPNDVISWASRYGNLEFIKYIVKNNIFQKKYGWNKEIKILNNAVSWASFGGHLEVIKYLIDNGVKITKEAIKYAINNNNLTIIQYFIEEIGFDVNYNNNEILIYCARWNRKDILHFLIKNGANINVLDIETRKKYGYYNEEEKELEISSNYDTESIESENEESIISIKRISNPKLKDKNRNKLYIIEEECISYFQIELLNKNKIIKLQKWNEIMNLKYNFTKITNINDKNNINYCYLKYLKDFYGNEIPNDKKDEVLIDYQNFIEYNKKINEIRFKYTGKINKEYDINEKEDVYQNKYNKILVYNDNSHMSFIIDNPDKYDLQLLESNICGYKKYFEFENNEIDRNINTTLISLFHEKYFDDEKSLIDKINSFKELFNIDDTLKRDVKTFISCNYNITDDINDKMKASELFNEIYKFLKIEEKINIRNKLTNFLLDIGLKKKRYNDGIYYYGLHKIK